MQAIDMLNERYTLYVKMAQLAQDVFEFNALSYYEGDSQVSIVKNKSGLFDNIKILYSSIPIMHIVDSVHRKSEFMGELETDFNGGSINVNQFYLKDKISDQDSYIGNEVQYEVFDLKSEGIEEQLFQESLLDNNDLFMVRLFVPIIHDLLKPNYEYYLRNMKDVKIEIIKEIILHLESILGKK